MPKNHFIVGQSRPAANRQFARTLDDTKFPAMSKILNFSYGSNMLSQRIRQRVPSARPVQKAVLQGYNLAWHKVGADGSAKCDIIRAYSSDGLVHGVVYELSLSEKNLLDSAEGLGNGYEELELSVKTSSGIVKAWAYYATHIDPLLYPYTWYKALVVAGAKEHGLPTQYIENLLAVAATEDIDATRSQVHFELAGSA